MWKNRLLYLIICVILGLFSILYNIRATMLVFGLILLFPIISYLCLRYSVRRVDFQLVAGTGVTRKGNKNSIQIGVENQGVLPITRIEFDVVYANSLIGIENTKHISLSFLGRMRQDVELFLSSEYVGNVSVRIDHVWIWDYSFCTRKEMDIEGKETLLVLPEEYLLEQALQTGSARLFENESILLNKPGSDLTEILDIREYVQGDRISRIHWKLSSKCDELMIKEYASQLYYYPIFLLDLRKGDAIGAKVLEAEYEVFYNFAAWHVDHGQPFQAAYYKEGDARLVQIVVASREELYALMQELYTSILSYDRTPAIREFFASDQAKNYSNIVYFTGDAAEDMECLRQMELFLVWFGSGQPEKEQFMDYEIKLGYGRVSWIDIHECRESCLAMLEQYMKESRGE